jgi:hypothetical protein
VLWYAPQGITFLCDKAAVLDVMINTAFCAGSGGHFYISISSCTGSRMGTVERFICDCINCPNLKYKYI